MQVLLLRCDAGMHQAVQLAFHAHQKFVAALGRGPTLKDPASPTTSGPKVRKAQKVESFQRVPLLLGRAPSPSPKWNQPRFLGCQFQPELAQSGRKGGRKTLRVLLPGKKHHKIIREADEIGLASTSGLHDHREP